MDTARQTTNSTHGHIHSLQWYQVWFEPRLWDSRLLCRCGMGSGLYCAIKVSAMTNSWCCRFGALHTLGNWPLHARVFGSCRRVFNRLLILSKGLLNWFVQVYERIWKAVWNGIMTTTATCAILLTCHLWSSTMYCTWFPKIVVCNQSVLSLVHGQFEIMVPLCIGRNNYWCINTIISTLSLLVWLLRH